MNLLNTTMTTKTTTKKVSKPRAKKVANVAAAPTNAMEARVFTMAGKEGALLTLPADIFGVSWKPDLVHQVTTALAANKRQNRAHTKDRAEVSGGGKKPWKQKGTGQARHGSSRSPIWRHGGVTFGPRSVRDYSEKINRKMKVGALLSVLSRKAKDGEIIFVDKLNFAAPKTAEALKALVAISKASNTKLLSTKGGNSALIALASHDDAAIKSFRNMQGVLTEEVRNLNPLNVLSYRYLVIEKPEEAFAALSSRAKK